jgi:hypothetical protein
MPGVISSAFLINRIADLRQLGLGWDEVVGGDALTAARDTGAVCCGCDRDGRRYQSGADNVWRLERVGDVVKGRMMKILAASGKGGAKCSSEQKPTADFHGWTRIKRRWEFTFFAFLSPQGQRIVVFRDESCVGLSL